MHCILSAKRAALAIIILIASAAVPSQSHAKTKPTRLASASTSQPEAKSVGQGFSPPARIFTIKQVLARIDAGVRAPEKDRVDSELRLPSLGDTDANVLPEPPHGAEPFGLLTLQAPDGALSAKWRRLELDLAAESKLIASCNDDPSRCSPATKQLQSIIEAAKAHSGRARLQEVNRSINGLIRYVSDLAQHGELDRWTAPLATLTAGRGDCEDYAIAKYVVLRSSGIPAEDLKLLLVRDRFVRQDHAVLAVRQGSRWLILDNRHHVLVESTALRHFTPLYALNDDGVKLFAAPYVQEPAHQKNVEILPATVATNADAQRPTNVTDTSASSAFIELPLLM